MSIAPHRFESLRLDPNACLKCGYVKNHPIHQDIDSKPYIPTKGEQKWPMKRS